MTGVINVKVNELHLHSITTNVSSFSICDTERKQHNFH